MAEDDEEREDEELPKPPLQPLRPVSVARGAGGGVIAREAGTDVRIGALGVVTRAFGTTVAAVTRVAEAPVGTDAMPAFPVGSVATTLFCARSVTGAEFVFTKRCSRAS